MKVEKKHILVFIIMLLAVSFVVENKASAQGTAMSSSEITGITNTASALTITLLNQQPDPAIAGSTVKLTFMVENTGSQDINNLDVSFVPVYPFYELPGETYTVTIPTVAAHQISSNAVTVKFNVGVDKNANDGTNQVKLIANTTDQSFPNIFNVDVTGQKFAQIMYIDRAILQPGNETPLKFTITNTGFSPLKNLIFSWNEPNNAILPVYSDNTQYIKYLDVGQSIDLPYTVVANINSAPGLYMLNLDLKFQTDNGSAQEIATKAGVSIGGETDFDVAFSQSSQGQVSLSVANIGNNPAYSVTVRIPRQPSFVTTGSDSSIVGNLDKGDYTLVSFQLSSAMNRTQNGAGLGQQTQNAQGQATQNNVRQYRNFTGGALGFAAGNDLQVEIDYTDTTGARHAVTKEVPVQLTSGSTTGSGTTGTFARRTTAQSSFFTNPFFIGGAIIVLIAGAVIIIRKRRKSNEILSKRK